VRDTQVDSGVKDKMGRHLFRVIWRLSIALLAVICCYRLIQDSARAGASRLFSFTAIIQSKLAAADLAVSLAPSDPEAHYTRALALVNSDRLTDAVVELRQATTLRPHHYYEWLDLGVTLDRLGDQTAAIAALKESVRLAPFFAQPRWQLGNVFFRLGRHEEAFAELRLGAKSNPNLFAGMLDLAWVAADGDVTTLEALVQPQSTADHLRLASFLARQGKGPDAARHVREAGEAREEGERLLLHQTITQLLAAQQFSDAYAAWALTHRSAGGDGAKGQVLNGSFTEPIIQDDPGFGWQLQPVPTVSVSIDPVGPGVGARSLHLSFGGDSAGGSQPIHQLVLIQPNSRYSLSFVARAENLVSGGPPVILVLDPRGDATKILGQSEPLAPGTSGWTSYKVDFSTDENISAVRVSLRRLACNQSPCPIFGKLWLSRFSLVKI